jgi:hypothetical protein
LRIFDRRISPGMSTTQSPPTSKACTRRRTHESALGGTFLLHHYFYRSQINQGEVAPFPPGGQVRQKVLPPIKVPPWNTQLSPSWRTKASPTWTPIKSRPDADRSPSWTSTAPPWQSTIRPSWTSATTMPPWHQVRSIKSPPFSTISTIEVVLGGRGGYGTRNHH